jgi:hypothetical protein
MLEYACGLILGLALISAENPNFEIASNKKPITAPMPYDYQLSNNHAGK